MSKTVLHPVKYFVKRACELGVKEAKIVSPKQVFTAEWVRRKCQFGCDGYGLHLTCPPYSPTPQETRRMLDEFEIAILLHSPLRGTNITSIVSKLEREAFLSGYYKAFGLGSGPCDLCERCNVQKVCKHVEWARPSMEACGIDVFQTARTAGYPIEVVRNHSCPQNYYGLLLLQ